MAKMTEVVLLVLLTAAIGCSDEANENAESSNEGDALSSNDGDNGTPDAQEPVSVADTEGSASPCPDGCNDGLYCTDDSCVDDACVFEVVVDTCLYEGTCFGAYELHPTDPCLVCEGLDGDGWSPVPDGLACNDGDPCTPEDACVAGLCSGPQMPCDDLQGCTDDICVDQAGAAECEHTANANLCDDSDPCTEDDTCGEGVCLGSAKCDDGNPCTLETCESDGTCVVSDLVCDDENSCTSNGCDPAVEGGCVFDSMEDGMACEAANYCLSGDVCGGGECIEGSEPVDCGEDGNPCTDDNCVPNVGCVYALNTAPCDDGHDCTEVDQCVATVCVGNPTPDCKACGTVSLGDIFLKATILLMGENGQPGEGLDVDGNPDTCAPATLCSGGVDNALGVLSSIFNPALETSIASGQNAPLIELKGFNLTGAPFDVAIYNGVPDPDVPGPCDVLAEVCEYVILPGSLLPDCTATLSVANATVSGPFMIAGGPGNVLVMGLPLAPDEIHYVFIVGGRIEAQLTYGEDGETIVGMDGVVAGAVPKDSLLASVASVNPALFGGLTTEEVLALVDGLVKEDIDLDGDGVFDAASVGIRISAIPAIVNGVKGE